MKNIILFTFCLVMFSSCMRFWYDKDDLDAAVEKHLNLWKTYNPNDTDFCVVDFNEIVPFEWDSMVYTDYRPKNNNSEELKRFINKYYPESYNRHYVQELHFIYEGDIVKRIEQDLISDEDKGTKFRTGKDFIKRGRKDAKFHVIENKPHFFIKEIEENASVLKWYY